jgi:DNA-binding response OmpR family regulator
MLNLQCYFLWPTIRGKYIYFPRIVNWRALKKMSDKIKVLAIDDDKFIQKVIVKALNSEQIEVISSLDGESAIETVSDTCPDVILLVVEMPGISGYETCEKLRLLPETCNTPIVFLTSHCSLREQMQGYEVGGDDYLVKPFETENLIARIKVLVSYNQERIYLKEQYELAQKTAVTAITGTSELGMAMRFLEKRSVTLLLMA